MTSAALQPKRPVDSESPIETPCSEASGSACEQNGSEDDALLGAQQADKAAVRLGHEGDVGYSGCETESSDRFESGDANDRDATRSTERTTLLGGTVQADSHAAEADVADSNPAGCQDNWQDDRQTGFSKLLARLRTVARKHGPSSTVQPPADGVFGNLVAKSTGPTDIDEESYMAPPDGPVPESVDGEETPTLAPPSYEEAAADATPSYWETTIMASDWCDEVFVGDLPVGPWLYFVWNMLISVAFSYVGFLLTYLIHTSHAARCGSLTGFGFTLIQSSYRIEPDYLPAPQPPPEEPEVNDPNNFRGSMPPSAGDQGAPSTNGSPADWLPNIMFIVGCVFIIKGISDYMRALAAKRAILRAQVPEEA